MDPQAQVSNICIVLLFFSILLINIVTLLLSLYRVLQIGPSKFDAELASRIMGPNEWLKNYVSLAQNYFAD